METFIKVNVLVVNSCLVHYTKSMIVYGFVIRSSSAEETDLFAKFLSAHLLWNNFLDLTGAHRESLK